MTGEDGTKVGRERRIAPTLRLGKLALDWEMVTARQVLQLRLAAEEMAGIGLPVPAHDLFVHLGIMRPNEVHLLLAKAGSEDRELAVRSPLADVTSRIQELADEAFGLGEVFPAETIAAVAEVRQRLKAVGIDLAPWQALAYRGDLGADRRVALEVALIDRERAMRAVEVVDSGRRGQGRILRTSLQERSVPTSFLAAALGAIALVALPLVGWALFGGPRRGDEPGGSEVASGEIATAAGEAPAPNEPARLAEAIGRPGVRFVGPGGTGSGAAGGGSNGYRPGGAPDGGGAAAGAPDLPASAFESNLEAVRRMLPRGVEVEPPATDGALRVEAASGTRGDRTAVRVAASAEFPDGVWLDLVLSYRGVPVVARRVGVKGERFDVQFDLPGPGRAPSGVYEATVTFHPARQHQELARRLAAEYPEGWQTRVPVAVGTAQDARREARDAADRFAAILESSRLGREALRKEALARSAKDAPLDEWVVYKKSWLEGVGERIERPLAREAAEFVIPPRPDASSEARILAGLLVDLAREASRGVHAAHGLAAPLEDERPMIERERDARAIEGAIDHVTAGLERALADLRTEGME